jgi:MGT family glycosyltransferase
MTPKRVLFVAFPEPGHLNPLIGVAQRLAAQGHAVAFFTHDDVSARLANAGLDGPAFQVGSKVPTRYAGPRTRTLGRILGDPVARKKWFYYLLFGTLDAQIEQLRANVAAFRPHVLAVDPLAYAGSIVAEQLGIPWAGISTQLSCLAPPTWDCPLVDAIRELEPTRDAEIAKHDVALSFRAGDVISRWLNVVFTTDSFIPRALSNNHYSFHVGPSRPHGRRGDEPEFPWDRLDPGAPLIYMAYGGAAQLSFDATLFQTIAEATHTLGAQVVMSLGDLVDEPFVAELPAHVIAVRFAPQVALLARAKAMVGHGGANSVMESLDAGVPSLILPLTHDQPLQGRFIESAGAGFHVAPAQLTVELATRLLGRLLADASPERARTAAIQASYAACDGAAATCELLVRLADSMAPIPLA